MAAREAMEKWMGSLFGRVLPDDGGMCQHMPVHSEVQVVHHEPAGKAQLAIQGIHPEGVPVLPVRGSGTAVTGGLGHREVVGDAVPAVAALGEVLGPPGLALGDRCPLQVADQPVDPVEAAHRHRVVVIEDDGEGLGPLWCIGYLEGDGKRRHPVPEILALGPVAVGDDAVLDRAAGDLHQAPS